MDGSREKYEMEMTKKLDAFKTAKEWSDFISLLSSLDNTIKKFSVAEIPRKKLLFKRLNQCLNPVLPAGIHNKTLETYSLIFERISRENLLKDFDFLTLGLFTFSAHCRILVTSSFLDLMERYIVPLGRDVERYCTSILIGLLPPMEFESGEYYSRAHLIMTEFKSRVSPEVFYCSMWSIFLGDERLRTPVVNYMMSMGREGAMVMNVNLVSKALCAGFGSGSTLVVRNCLDLLIFVFPDRNYVEEEDVMEDLIEAVIKLFVKRDLSLNKRIYSWMNMTDSFNKVDVVLLSRALGRCLERGGAEDIQLFFRIMMTLQDKGKLCERIMQNLLLDVLECLRRYRKGHGDGDIELSAFGEGPNEGIDVEKIAKVFLTTDLDGVWKIFYLQLKASLKEHARERMLLDVELADDEEFHDSMMRDEMSSMHTMSLILNEGYAPSSESVSANGSESGGRDERGRGRQEGGSSPEGRDRKRNAVAKMMLGKEGGGARHAGNPNRVLGLIRFAVDNYSAVDSEVFHYHLPFLVHLALSNSLFFEPRVLFSFLGFSAKTMRFDERQAEGGQNLQKLINRFYLEEDTSVLDQISSTILYSISDKIGRVVESNVGLSLSLMSSFIEIHGVDVFPSGFIQNYHELVLKSPTSLIKEHLEVYRLMDCKKFDPKGMFDVLWERFCSVGKVPYLEGKDRGEGEEEKGSRRSSRPEWRDGADRKVLAGLLWEYNMVFGGSFEKLFLRRIGEGQVEEVSYFLLLKLENFAGNFDFLELYYVVNCKLDADDPVLGAFLCSLVCFDDIFKFLLRKLEDSNVQVNSSSFVDSVDFNQIFGVFGCIKNLLRYSRRFRTMLMESVERLDSRVFSPNDPVFPREMLYRVLVYLLVHKKEYDGRDLDIEVIKLLELLVRSGVLTSNVVNSVDLSRVVDVAKENREDPAIVLGVALVVKHSGNGSTIQELCSVLDSKCFYYHGFLEFVFSLTDRLQRKVLANIIFSLENEGFALMIAYEVISSMLTKRGGEGELPGFIDKSMSFIFEFFERQYVDPDGDFSGDAIEESKMMPRDALEEVCIAEQLCVVESANRGDARTCAMKLATAKELSSLFFKKVPIKFVESILENSPCISFLKSIDFREQLYISVMNLYSTNPAKVFRFLGVLNQVMSLEEMTNVFHKSKGLIEKISSYRAGADYSPLNFSLNFLLALELREGDEVLVQTVVLNSIYFLQKRLDLKIRNGEKDYRDDMGLLDRITDFRFQGTIVVVVPNLILVILALANSDSLELKKAGVDFLVKLAERGLDVRHWKKEFLEIFHTLDFFTYSLHKKSNLMKRIVVEDPSVINDLIARLDSGFFVSQASDANNKTLVLKRISHIIFSAPYNYFSGFSLKLVEKIATLINHPSSRVRREVFFLSKMLILKISHDKLINLYPILLYDIGMVIENPDFEDMALLGEAMKLLDVIFLLGTPQFAEARVVFLDPRVREDIDGEAEALRSGLCALRKSLEEKYKKDVASRAPQPKKKIPLLVAGRVEVEDIMGFVTNASSYYNWVDEHCSEIDYGYLFGLVLEELKEAPE